MDDDVVNGATPSRDFGRLEARVSAALRRHADRFEPSANSFDRLVDAVEAGGSRAGRPLYRPLSMVAALVIVLGAGAVLLNQVGGQQVDTVAPTGGVASAIGVGDDDGVEAPLADEDEPSAGQTGSSSDDEESAVEAGSADETAPVPGEGVDVEDRPDDAEVAGTEATWTGYAPIGSTDVEAGQEFLDLLGLDEVVAVAVEDRVEVHMLVGDEGRLVPTGTVLSFERHGSGFAVSGATSDQVGFEIDDGRPVIDGVVAVTEVGPELVVSGAGTGNDVTVAIDVISAGVGSPIAATSVAAGGTGQAGLFDARLPLVGTDRAWLVVRSVGDGGGGAQDSFAARPILVRGVADTTDYTVIGLTPDDPDGGLVVRAAPAGRRLGVIPSGSTGVRLRDVPAEREGRLAWLPVTTPDGLEGWVAAPYLAPDRDVSTATLKATAAQLVDRLVTGDYSFGPDVGVADSILIGDLLSPVRFRGDIRSGSISLTGRAVSGDGEPVKTSLFDYYGVADWARAALLVPNAYLSEAAEASARSHFGTLPSLAVEVGDESTGERRRVHVFVSRPPDHVPGPPLTVHGIVTEFEDGHLSTTTGGAENGDDDDEVPGGDGQDGQPGTGAGNGGSSGGGDGGDRGDGSGG